MIKIKYKELIDELIEEKSVFPKYATQIINLANQNAQGTRPKVVGQLSELIQKCPHKEYKKWKEWYLKEQPKAINDATEKIFAMIKNLKTAFNEIDEPLVKKWVEDLVLAKTFIGLRLQEAILKKVAKFKKATYRLSTASEESKGIDGFIGETPVSIKPTTYKSKNMLNEDIKVRLIFYEKKKNFILLDLSNLD